MSSLPSPSPGVFDDGSFGYAAAVSPPIFETPFKADPLPYVYKQRYWVRFTSYIALPLDSFGPYGGFHVGETGFRDEGGGIISFDREFANVPRLRSEFESFVYSYQDAKWDSSSAEITETPLTVPTRIQFDYFHTTDPTSIQLDKAPRAVVIFDELYKINGWGSLQVGKEALAEDATMKCWRGNIYERQQRFFKVRDLTGEGPAFP